jgi:hydroxyacylglutathione hydrolase
LKISDRVYLVGSGAIGGNQTNAYDCNVYLIDCGTTAMLVDSGAGIEPHSIMNEIIHDGFSPDKIEYLFITHAHADHAGGAFALKQITGAKVICSTLTSKILRSADEEANSLADARKERIYPSDYIFNKCEVYREMEEGDVLKIGELSFEFIATPGHSKDSFSCFSPELKSLFSGDVIFEGGKIAALKTKDFSITELRESVKKIDNLPIENIFPGHLLPMLSNSPQSLKQVIEIFKQSSVPQSIV